MNKKPNLILQKLYKKNEEHLLKDIKEHYKNKGYCIISFLYFANAMKYRLFEQTNNNHHISYKKTLLASDFLLPDGIALQVFYRIKSLFNKKLPTKRCYNLNGTDLTPKLLKHLKKEKTHIAVMSFYDDSIGKNKERLDRGVQILQESYNIDIDYHAQTQYKQKGKDIDRSKYEKKINQNNTDTNILILCLGTPIQELITTQQHTFIKQNKIIVINAGGRIDFISGYEKRAPKRLVKLRVGETFYRIITNPKKNLKKFLAMFGVFRLLIPGKPRKIPLKKG